MLGKQFFFLNTEQRCTGKLRDSGKDLAGQGWTGEMWWRRTSKEWD